MRKIPIGTSFVLKEIKKVMKKQILVSLTACLVGSTISFSMGTPTLPIVLEKSQVQKAEVSPELLQQLREIKNANRKIELQQVKKQEAPPATLRQVKDFKEEYKDRK